MLAHLEWIAAGAAFVGLLLYWAWPRFGPNRKYICCCECAHPALCNKAEGCVRDPEYNG